MEVWEWGRQQLLPFRRKPESHSRDSENFPRSGTLQWSPFGECGYRRRDSGFRRNGNSFNFAAYLFSISPLSIPAPFSFHSPPLFPFPRKRESPCVWGKTGYARLAPIPSQCGAGVARTQNREIPAFAGMGKWGEWGIGGNENTDIIPPPSALFAAGKRKRESETK